MAKCVENSTKSIALLGFMGAGKTTVGKALASRLGFQFVDLDQVLISRYGPILQQFERFGEAEFRKREHHALQHVPDQNTVLSTGGGIIENVENRCTLEQRFHTIFLDAPLDLCKERVGAGCDRPLWNNLSQRFTRRHPLYQTARHHLSASDTVPEIVEQIVRLRQCRTVPIHLPSGSYQVRVTSSWGPLKSVDPTGGHLVSDTNVAPLWRHRLPVELRDLPTTIIATGEQHKTLQTWSHVVDQILGTTTRGSPVFALGGGIVGDIAGFAAASVARGLPFVQLPTTLLAMVDSSVGGKTGVNHALGKNLIGAFHQPCEVQANLSTLTTLPKRELISGAAEIAKIALLCDPPLLSILEHMPQALSDPGHPLLPHIVTMAIRAKARIVCDDPLETGLRMVLNGGHTVGHAIERAAPAGSILHGEAVAIGLVAETAWAEENGYAHPGSARRVASLLITLGLPVCCPTPLSKDAMISALTVDKKMRRDTLWLPVFVRAGSHLRVELPRSRLGDLLASPIYTETTGAPLV